MDLSNEAIDKDLQFVEALLMRPEDLIDLMPSIYLNERHRECRLKKNKSTGDFQYDEKKFLRQPQRAPKRTTPDEVKRTDKYLMRRIKNNEQSRKWRESHRSKPTKTDRLQLLDQEQADLLQERNELIVNLQALVGFYKTYL
jgi:hypothetical protein